MKRIIFITITLVCLFMIACKNSGSGNDPMSKQADSLEKEVMNEHDTAMGKTSKIPKLRKEIQRLLDSIGTLPAKAQEAAASLKVKLEELRKDIDYADFAMDKWMGEFNYDSARNNLNERIKYLMEEKLKVSKVKEAVVNGLAKADSLLKAKF